MTERGSEMPDLASAAPSAPANNNPEVGDPTVVIDEELLSEEVKKYPILYENAYTDYMEKMAKIENWNKVCQSLFKEWSEFSPTKKKVTIKLVQNKWQKQTDKFFMSYKRVQKHPTAKRSKKHMDSMTFLVPPTVASDVDEGTCGSNTNTDAAQVHIADVMPMDMPPLQSELEIPQVNTPDNPPVPSTSERVGEYARSCEFARPYEVHKPFFIPMTDIGLQQQANSNPNMHFALMLIPLLNRLNQNALYNAWPEILNTIKNAECPKRLEILQQELVYNPAVKTQENAEYSCISTAEVPPEEEAVQENPTYPCSYGRPTNPDGEIMYPETDHEDLDEG